VFESAIAIEFFFRFPCSAGHSQRKLMSAIGRPRITHEAMKVPDVAAHYLPKFHRIIHTLKRDLRRQFPN